MDPVTIDQTTKQEEEDLDRSNILDGEGRAIDSNATTDRHHEPLTTITTSSTSVLAMEPPPQPLPAHTTTTPSYAEHSITKHIMASERLKSPPLPPSSEEGTVISARENDAKNDSLSASSMQFPPASSTYPVNSQLLGNSSGSETEHIPTPADSVAAVTAVTLSTSTTTTSAPTLLSTSAIAAAAASASSSAHINDNSALGGGVHNNNNNNNNQSSSSMPRIRSKNTRVNIASRPSSLSSKSRGSHSTSRFGANKPHAYFASSEEESEAELDEKDSHSSRASNSNYGGHHHSSSHHNVSSKQKHPARSSLSKSSLRGSKKLTEIAKQHASLHSSRVRMTIPQNHHDATTATTTSSRDTVCQESRSGGGGPMVSSSSASKPLIPSIYKTTSSHINSHSNAVPPPPQTVVVGKNNSADGKVGILGPGAILPPSSSTLKSSAAVAMAALNNNSSPPTRKRIRKKRRHKHLPRGLPVFKDPRSCMWTSTHDANAPSEDRYSSLVNVLLRPPKTPTNIRKKKDKGDKKKPGGGNGGGNGNGNGNNNANAGNGNNTPGGGGGAGGGSKSGSSCDGSSEEEEENTHDSPQGKTGASGDASQSTLPAGPNNSTPPANINNEDDEDNTSLIRLSLWSVIDGHGGGCVATYAAEVLLPHIAASVARALKSEIVDRGVCNVNGQLRDANALDLDGLIRSSDRSRHVGKSQVRQREAGIDVVNPNSIHYRSPYEDSESEGDVGVDRGVDHDHFDDHDEEETTSHDHHHRRHVDDRSESESEAESEAPVSVASSLLPGNPITHGESASSVKTSVKTAVSPVTQHAPVGTHSPAEVASITRAITDSFLAVDEGWINSIDPVTTHQTSCVSNGRWNAGACALVVFIVQRLDWCRSSRVDHETHHRERGARGFEDTSHNKDAARRRKLDYATKSKSVSSLSTLSSTSSITTEANTTESMLVEESEITETEDDDDVSDIFGPRKRRRKKGSGHHHYDSDDPHHQEGVFIATPAGCKCHYYRPHDAMLYTAHVGDCRAVMLGSAPPRTIKVPPEQGNSTLSLDHTSEDESTSESIADEISSSEHDSDSSGEHFLHGSARAAGRGGTSHALGYVRRATAKRQRRNEKPLIEQPFVPLPPLNRRRDSSSEESAVESDDSASTTAEEHLPPPGGIVRATGRVVDPRGVVTARPVVDVNHDPTRVVFNNLSEEEKLLETEDEDEIKEMRSVRSGSPTQMDRPPSPTQLVADPVHPPPLPLSMLMRPIDLTTDHSAYNPAEVTAVLRRCNNAPKAISSASGGGIKRVAGSLAVTRALGDAYLKTPRLSFFPYKRHAPYITARPEVNCRVLTKGADRILTLASDGVWERASGDDVLRWVRNYYNARIAGVKDQHLHSMYDMEEHDPYNEDGPEKSLSRSSRKRLVNEEEVLGGGNPSLASSVATGSSGEISSEDGSTAEAKTSSLTAGPPVDDGAEKSPARDDIDVNMNKEHHIDEKVEDSDTATTSEGTGTTTAADETTTTSTIEVGGSKKRKHPDNATTDDSVSSRSASTASSTFGRGVGATMELSRRHLRSSSRSPYSLSIPTVSEVIVRKVLNKVRKTRNISSLRMLMSLPKGRARRSKHDDITATVVDLSGFVS